MTAVLIGLAIIVAVLVLWLVIQGSQSQKKNRILESQMSELRRDLQSINSVQAQSAGKVEAVAANVSQRLDGLTPLLQEALKKSAEITGNIAQQAQSAMAVDLKNTRDQIGQIQKQLGEVQEAGKQMSQTAHTLEGILGGAKSRGSFGEVTLERLLEDSIPKSQYNMQYRFSNGETADAVIFLRDKKLMAIDSKFPLDAFKRIAAEGDDARKAFATAVKGHADAIAKKYIVPDEGTLDVALMYVPSESVYYELLMVADAKGQQLDAYCRDKKIIAVSPNTLYAHLMVIAMGMRGMQIEENAKHLYASLSGMQKQMETFTGVFEKLGNHLKNAQQSYTEGEKRLEKAQDTLDGLASGVHTEGLLEGAQATLTLPIESNTKKGA